MRKSRREFKSECFSFLLFEKVIPKNVARDLHGISSIFLLFFFSFSLLLLHRFRVDRHISF